MGAADLVGNADPAKSDSRAKRIARRARGMREFGECEGGQACWPWHLLRADRVGEL
jgi:hypothetical protein